MSSSNTTDSMREYRPTRSDNVSTNSRPHVTSLEVIDGDVVSVPASTGITATDRSRHSLNTSTFALINVSGYPAAQIVIVRRSPGASVSGNAASTVTAGRCGRNSIFV